MEKPIDYERRECYPEEVEARMDLLVTTCLDIVPPKHAAKLAEYLERQRRSFVSDIFHARQTER